MAKNDNKGAIAAPTNAEMAQYANLLPPELAGLAGELHTTGGLIPMYIPKKALEDPTLPPVAGWLDRLVMLKEIQQGANRVFTPLMAQIVVTTDTVAFVKEGDDAYRTVPIKAGEELYFPVSANLLYNQDFVRAITDKNRVTFAILRVAGERKVNGQASKMIEIDCLMAGKPPASKPREGRFAFPLDVVLSRGADNRPIAHLANGEYSDMNGEVTKQLPLAATA